MGSKEYLEGKVWNLEVYLSVCPYADKNRNKYVRMLNIFRIRLKRLIK